MNINNSERGWREYHIPNFLKTSQRDGYKKLARLEELYGLEIVVHGDMVYVRTKFEKKYG